MNTFLHAHNLNPMEQRTLEDMSPWNKPNEYISLHLEIINPYCKPQPETTANAAGYAKPTAKFT
jgi:hypothetical protein